MERHEGGYYIRLMARDVAGTAAKIATHLAKAKISLESIVQRRRSPHAGAPEQLLPNAPQPVILITYETTEEAIKDALERIFQDGHIAHQPQLIRIEPLG